MIYEGSSIEFPLHSLNFETDQSVFCASYGSHARFGWSCELLRIENLSLLLARKSPFQLKLLILSRSSRDSHPQLDTHVVEISHRWSEATTLKMMLEEKSHLICNWSLTSDSQTFAIDWILRKLIELDLNESDRCGAVDGDIIHFICSIRSFSIINL